MTIDYTNPADLKAAHRSLGLSAAAAARLFMVHDGAVVRKWYSGRNRPAGAVIVLTRALMESPAVCDFFGLRHPGGQIKG